MFAARYIKIGAKIRYYRIINKMEQAEFAEKIGVTRQYLSKIETGRAKPSTDLLFKIAYELNIDVATIMKNDNSL